MYFTITHCLARRNIKLFLLLQLSELCSSHSNDCGGELWYSDAKIYEDKRSSHQYQNSHTVQYLQLIVDNDIIKK